jgi:FtsP/CotA-like multicopper oxidase with cupredoxin domain
MRPADVTRRLLYGGLLGLAPVYVALAAPHHTHVLAAASLGQDPSGHQALEGLGLVSVPHAEVDRTTTCPAQAPVRRYDVVALAVDITVNRYGDHDPQGRMYALTGQLAAVRAQETAAARARAGRGPVPVTRGLQGDPIQPLTLRVLPGECLRVNLRDDIPGEAASFHLHGVPWRVVSTGRAATENEPSAVAQPGSTVSYEWAVPASEPSATHYAHSHGSNQATARKQTEHGLYAAVVVEPPGATWIDPRTPGATAGWDAIVRRQDGSSFREFTLFYAEDGDEPYQPLTRQGAFVPLVDDLTGAYKPAARWVNYRSEPFLDRLALEQEKTGRYDESGAYSSYAFGDPATPVMRSYLGDPVVQRVLHAGSEVLHVHHVHGGSIRWRRQPGLGPVDTSSGLTKKPALLPGPSERTDAQSMAPAETFDQWSECGSGGCQASVGDFLWHCHVAQHYFAGMWGLWRVYGTLQNGRASTDALPPLMPLSELAARVRPAVPASALLGQTVRLAGRPTRVTPAVLTAWLQRVLPPPGRARGYSAGVWDWVRQGQDVLGEPEDTRVWPGYASRTPGKRPEVLFDPVNGMPAYPFLRPHLGKRPPFAPGHGPAPYLDPTSGAGLPAPGADGPASVCPAGTTQVRLPVTAVLTPVQLAPGITDPHGELYVRNEALASYRAQVRQRVPLVVRARAQRDCIDVTLVSALTDDAETHGLSKADMHIHFVQFDVQGSDGVVAGFNAEQSVRPWRTATVALAAPAPAGAKVLQLQGIPLCQVGENLALGPERPDGAEVVKVAAIRGRTVTLQRPVLSAHPAGEPTTTEFVRYRWYPDAQTGTAYFHDHVDAISSWRHGLFGALVVEPPDATWTDPSSGAPLTSGNLADITTRGSVGVDEQGSFREFVALLQDDVRVNQSMHSQGGALGERASPSLGEPGAPATVVRAYVGDPVVLRTLVPGTNDVHTLFVEGHRFRSEAWSPTSPPVDALHVGISERYDVVIPAAGGDGRRAGDYVFGDGRTSKLREGVWGVLRVLPRAAPGLRPLTGRVPQVAATGPVCPRRAPVVRADVTATEISIPEQERGAAFVPTGRAEELQAHPDRLEPLVLHVAVGDCLRVALHNAMPSDPVQIQASLLVGDPAAKPLAPGERGSYDFWASPALGEATAQLRDVAEPLNGPARGIFGAVVVAARGSRFLSPQGRGLPAGAPGTAVIVHPPGQSAYRDFTVFPQDSDGDLGTHAMPYRHQVLGVQAMSYGQGHQVLEAYQGDPLRMHVVAVVSEQVQGFALDGHRWPLEPGAHGTNVVAAQAIGGRESFTIEPLGGAGGEAHLRGDFVYGDTRAPYRDAGEWGVLRVLPSPTPGLAPLSARSARVLLAFLVAAGLAVLVLSYALRVMYAARRPQVSEAG